MCLILTMYMCIYIHTYIDIVIMIPTLFVQEPQTVSAEKYNQDADETWRGTAEDSTDSTDKQHVKKMVWPP